MLRSLVEKHGGVEVKHQGDGLMVAFSSARRAILCAVDIQASMIERNAAEPETPLSVRIGLNTGEVIAEDAATKAVAGRLSIPLVDRGEQRLRELRDPCRMYEAVWRPS
jgi:class 3 adenylate cyclase